MDRDAVVQQMSDVFSRFKRAMHQYTFEHFNTLGLSPAQFGLLKAIDSHGQVSQKQLASELRMTPGAISQLAEIIEAEGFVVRKVSEQDRRSSQLSVSASGAELLAKYTELRQKLMSEALNGVSTEDLASYVRVQQSLIDWLESNTDKGDA